MEAEEFSKKWKEGGDKLNQFTSERLQQFNLNSLTINYLLTSGLPQDAAPFLTFVNNTTEQYYGVDLLTKQFDFLESEYEKYLVIGSDGSGDLIVINMDEKDQINWLDHEDYFAQHFMNTNLSKLLESLLHYRTFVNTTIEIIGDEAYSSSDFRDEEFNVLKQKLEQTDQMAIKTGFWQEELELLLANRDSAKQS